MINNVDKDNLVTESDSNYYQRALDLEALGLMGIEPDEKYRREVDVVFSQGEFLSLPQNSNVLDLACGRGDTSKLLRERGFNVIALDSSNTAIETAGKRFPDEGIDFRVGDMKNPPKAQDGYDAITCFGRSLAYFKRYEEYVEALKNWREALKDNGKIAIEWTEWVDGVSGGKFQSLGNVEVQKEPDFQIVNKKTGEILRFGESVTEEFQYPGEQLPMPIEKRRGGRIFIDSDGQTHDFGGEGTMFVDLLRQRNFPLIKRILNEAGYINVRLVEALEPLTPPGQPKTCKVFAVIAEKSRDGSPIESITSDIRSKTNL